MHDIFGPEVIDIFDMQYNPGDNPIVPPGSAKPKKKEPEPAQKAQDDSTQGNSRPNESGNSENKENNNSSGE